MAVIIATTGAYVPDSQNKISFTGFVDGSGTPLSNANGSAKITITDSVAGTVLVNAAAMTYSGTPGQWDYTGTFDKFPDFTTLSVVLAGYDNTGATLYITQDVTLTPNAMAQGTYSRNSINTITFPAYAAPGGALLDNTNSLAKVSIATVAGASVLAANNMTYNSTPKTWTYNDVASHYGAGQKLIVTCQGWDITGTTTLYRTSRILLLDGG